MKQPKKQNGADLRKEGAKWIERVKAASKFEKSWLDDAHKAAKAYTNEAKSEGESEELGVAYDYNILFANVETIVPAVINSQPLPDIRRRFGDADPVARRVADIIERGIRVQTDDNKLQIEMEGAAQDSFLAGRGIVRLRFKSDIVGGEPTDEEIEDAAESRDEGSDSEGEGYSSDAVGLRPGQPANGQNQERLENERITFEAVSWRDYRHGPAKRWDERPWDAFRFCIPREEEADQFDADLISSQLQDNEKTERSGAEGDLTGWEIWCKKTRKVKFIDDDGVIVKEIDDPLGLANFFPICTPMQPIEVTGRLKPVNPFSIYRKLADELDDITKRINKLVDAMRVKGWYSGTAKNIEAVITLADNEFAAIPDDEIWAQNGGLEGAIAFWPIEKFIVALRELYVARDQTKQAIYEITGISDIVRGASQASETATAQNIKNQWGSLRIQKMQRMIERASRDIFILMAEILTSKFSYETLEEMTGISILPRRDDPPEELQMKQAVIALMKRRISSYYRIDVESDSTIRADLTRQKAEVAEFLQGAAAYFQAVAPLVQQGALPADAAVDIFASTARMFNLGKSVEDTLEKMVVDAKKKAAEPQQEKPDPEMVKAQLEQQKMQGQAQIEASKAQTAQALAQTQIESIRAKLEADLSAIAAKTRQSEIDAQTKTIEANAKMQADSQSHAMEMQKGQLELVKIQAEIEKIRAGTQATVEGARAKAEAAQTSEKETA